MDFVRDQKITGVLCLMIGVVMLFRYLNHEGWFSLLVGGYFLGWGSMMLMDSILFESQEKIISSQRGLIKSQRKYIDAYRERDVDVLTNKLNKVEKKSKLNKTGG